MIGGGRPSAAPTDEFGVPNHLNMTPKSVPKTDPQTAPQTAPRGVPWGVLWVPPRGSPGGSHGESPGGPPGDPPLGGSALLLSVSDVGIEDGIVKAIMNEIVMVLVALITQVNERVDRLS